MTKPSGHVLELLLEQRAEMAFKAAVEKVIVEHSRQGLPIYIRRDGKLMLAFDDVIALALENNLEIAVARYDLPIAQTDLLRAQEGDATRGVASSHQSTTIFSGSRRRRVPPQPARKQ